MMRMMWQPLEFTTREGSKAAYVNQLFRIENVIFVTSLHDTASKRREQQQREKNSPAVLKVFCRKHVLIPNSRRFLIRRKGIPKTARPIITLKNAGNMSIINYGIKRTALLAEVPKEVYEISVRTGVAKVTSVFGCPPCVRPT